MKKKLLAIATLLLCVAVMPTVKAAEQPTYVEIGTLSNEKAYFFANGTPITIEERPDGQAGALIKWNGGEQLVPENISVYGASHESDTRYETTSITMNGGKIYGIVGGGLHKSNVGTTNITINGGTYTNVSGGGAASASKTNCHRPLYAGDPKQSPNRVDVANVTINGGTSTSTVYGGGEGISYTGTANVTVNGGTMVWVTAGGSNGYTGSTEVSVTDGTITTLQSVNRGSMNDTAINVTGGKIENLVGGTKGTGTIDSVVVEVAGGQVTNLLVGTIGGTADGNGDSAKDVVEIIYNEKYVENIDTDTFNEDAIVKTVTLTFKAEGESESIEIPYGFAFSQEEVDELINELKESLKEEGYTIDDFYADEALTTKYDLTKPIERDTTVYMKLVEEAKATDKAPQEVANAKTGDMNLIMVLSLLSLAGVAVAVTGKKIFANNNI